MIRSYRTRLDGTTRVAGVSGKCKVIRSKIKGTTIEAHGDGTATIKIPGTGVRGGMVVWEDDAGEHSTACVVPTQAESDEQDAEFGKDEFGARPGVRPR